MSIQKTEFHVNRMKCDGCVKTATEAVAKVQGVEKSEFDYSAGAHRQFAMRSLKRVILRW